MTEDLSAALRELALRVAAEPPASMQDADQLEAELLRLDPNLPGYEHFEMALACYRPGGGDHLVDEAGLQAAARELLHDLGHHELCLHDVPLADRP